MSKNGFHAQDGLFFERLHDGTVRVKVYKPGEACQDNLCIQTRVKLSSRCWHNQVLVDSFDIAENVWASVVCSMIKTQDQSPAWNAFRKLHNEAGTEEWKAVDETLRKMGMS